MHMIYERMEYLTSDMHSWWEKPLCQSFIKWWPSPLQGSGRMPRCRMLTGVHQDWSHYPGTCQSLSHQTSWRQISWCLKASKYHLELINLSKIWQVAWQHCCQATCQISETYNYLIPNFVASILCKMWWCEVPPLSELRPWRSEDQRRKYYLLLPIAPQFVNFPEYRQNLFHFFNHKICH